MRLYENYQELCQNNNYQMHPAQINIIRHLEAFGHNYIENAQKLANSPLFLKWGALFFKKEKVPTLPLGVYIYGGVGRGKSMIMDLFFDSLPIKRKKRIHFHQFMQDTHQYLKTARAEDHKDPLIWTAQKLADNVDFICFDEFQVLDITDAMILGRLFTALINLGVHFMMTSNRPPDDLYKNGLNRQLFLPFIAQLKSRFDILTLDHAIDFRFEKIRQRDHYLTPLNQDTANKMQDIWHILTDNHEASPYEIDHKGRKLHFEKSYKHILWADFNALCDVAYGAGDYLVIAEHFSVLLLDHIPELTKEMRNQATRFRNLIDAFYEKRHKIYFRSAAAAQLLYPEGDYAFEFERTLSRIQEMQSENYGNDTE